jgi:SAM-dependent methyltransferase
MLPEWRTLLIHESSPADRGISSKLKSQGLNYFPSQYFPMINNPMVGDIYNINLESQLFEDEKFDVFVSLDVFEHVFDPKTAIQEIYRTLKPGGIALLTFPIIKSQVDALTFRATLVNGNIEFLKPAEYHGNPIDDKGSLVTVDYGYEIHNRLSEWSKFNIEVVRFNRPDIGVLGEFTEVIICQK